jgi:hypothetical protein
MRTLYTDAERIMESLREASAEFTDKETLLKEPDFVSSIFSAPGDDSLYLDRELTDEENSHLMYASRGQWWKNRHWSRP